jgi:hypothetical protein
MVADHQGRRDQSRVTTQVVILTLAIRCWAECRLWVKTGSAEHVGGGAVAQPVYLTKRTRLEAGAPSHFGSRGRISTLFGDVSA